VLGRPPFDAWFSSLRIKEPSEINQRVLARNQKEPPQFFIDIIPLKGRKTNYLNKKNKYLQFIANISK